MHEWQEVDYTTPSGVASNVDVMRSYLGDYFNCDPSVTAENLSRAKHLLGISDATYNSLLSEFEPTFESEPSYDLPPGSYSLDNLLGL